MITVLVHRFAGRAETLTAHTDRSPARYGLDLASAGFRGNVPALVDRLEAGDIVHIEQFDVTVYKTEHAGQRANWSA